MNDVRRQRRDSQEAALQARLKEGLRGTGYMLASEMREELGKRKWNMGSIFPKIAARIQHTILGPHYIIRKRSD
jgi:hypothetical protein